jgi:hypothetical protein
MKYRDIDAEIYNILSNKKYYSLSIKSLSRKIPAPISYLKSLDNKINTNFKTRFGDHINIFTYNNIEYIGLESRRIAYEIDKINGCNWVEDAIRVGLYDKQSKNLH